MSIVLLFVHWVIHWVLILNPGGKKVKPWQDLLKFNKKSFGVFYSSDIFIVVPLVVSWAPILDPGGKSEILIGLYKIQ